MLHNFFHCLEDSSDLKIPAAMWMQHYLQKFLMQSTPEEANKYKMNIGHKSLYEYLNVLNIQNQISC